MGRLPTELRAAVRLSGLATLLVGAVVLLLLLQRRGVPCVGHNHHGTDST